MRPRTNKRSAFATKCMVLAAYLTVNMGIGCVIAITTTWFWWVYMMMGILLFLLGVRIIIFGLSLTALLQFSRRHRRQRKTQAARTAVLAVMAAPRGKSSSDLGSGVNPLQPQQQSEQQPLQQFQRCSEGGSSMTRQECDVSSLQHPLVNIPTVQSGWGSFSDVQTAGQLVQQPPAVPLAHHSPCLQSEWCKHSPV